MFWKILTIFDIVFLVGVILVVWHKMVIYRECLETRTWELRQTRKQLKEAEQKGGGKGEN